MNTDPQPKTTLQTLNPNSTTIISTTLDEMPDLSIRPTTHTDTKHLTSPTTTCSTGCVFGSLEHAAHLEFAASASGSREHLVPPPGVYLPSASSSTSGVYYGLDHASLPDLIARYGTSSSTAWLDSDRYKIWRPSQPIPESEFVPVQGYIQKDPYVFAWGNPLVSSPTALEKTARAFIAFAEANHLHPIWSCVDHDLEQVLSGSALGWVTVSCIFEDVVDPAHVIDLVNPEHEEAHIDSKPGDLRRNLQHAELEQVEVYEVRRGQWTNNDRDAVEIGVREWKAHRHMELESMTLEPWIDVPHRRYWVAKRRGKVIGFEILSQTSPTSWQIIKCLTFRHSTQGTSEKLVYTALKDLYDEQEASYRLTSSMPIPHIVQRGNAVDEPNPSIDDERTRNRVMVSFGITASDHIVPGHNISGWKVNVLSMTYHAVSGIVGLIKTGQYRSKFDAAHEPMYVCYPANGFGFMAIGALIMALRK